MNMVKRGSKNISFVVFVWTLPSHNVTIPYSMQCHKDFLFEHSKENTRRVSFERRPKKETSSVKLNAIYLQFKKILECCQYYSKLVLNFGISSHANGSAIPKPSSLQCQQFGKTIQY